MGCAFSRDSLSTWEKARSSIRSHRFRPDVPALFWRTSPHPIDPDWDPEYAPRLDRVSGQHLLRLLRAGYRCPPIFQRRESCEFHFLLNSHQENCPPMVVGANNPDRQRQSLVAAVRYGGTVVIWLRIYCVSLVILLLVFYFRERAPRRAQSRLV